MKPLAIDFYSGLGGWAHGFLAEGYRVIGFDIERHRYPIVKQDGAHLKNPGFRFDGSGRSFQSESVNRRAVAEVGEWDEYPGELVLQDVLTLHGSQFRHADCIVASPPCQEYSYMAMPWSRAKQIAAALRGQGPFPEGYEGSRNLEQLNALFNACFRIQLEASQAAGRHIPLVIENVKGAQPWVGRAKANYGSYYLWGDVESVGGRIVAPGAGFGAAAVRAQLRVQKFNPDGTEHPQGSWFVIADSKERGARKGPGGDWFEDGRQGQDACSAAIKNADTAGRTWFGISHGREYEGQSGNPVNGTKGFATGLGRGHARKAASAMIAKIPFELASHIARCFKPVRLCAVRQNE